MTERVDQVLYIPGLNDQSHFNKKKAEGVQGDLEKHGVKVTVFKMAAVSVILSLS